MPTELHALCAIMSETSATNRRLWRVAAKAYHLGHLELANIMAEKPSKLLKLILFFRKNLNI